MLSFTTDDLRAEDCFDHWCEVRGKSLFGVTIELPHVHRASFRGRFSAVDIGGAVVSNMAASSYQVSRTVADIARLAADSLCIGLQVRGPGWVETGFGPPQFVNAGDFTLSHSDLPFAATPQRSDGFDYRMLKIPIAGDILLDSCADDLSARTVNNQARFARPFAALFDALTKQPVQGAAAAEDIAHMARLAMIVSGRLAHGSHECRAALRVGFLHAARAILARDLRLPGLSPQAVAKELGISLRQVHVLFEPTGLSFARTLTAMRLEEACRLLKAMPSCAITEIALRCGFDSIATFYRVFRSTYGMVPRDMRSLKGSN